MYAKCLNTGEATKNITVNNNCLKFYTLLRFTKNKLFTKIPEYSGGRSFNFSASPPHNFLLSFFFLFLQCLL